jgi:hypothetical protein
MFEVAEDFEALLDDLVALPVLDIGDHADAAGIAFAVRIVEALRIRASGLANGVTVCAWMRQRMVPKKSHLRLPRFLPRKAVAERRRLTGLIRCLARVPKSGNGTEFLSWLRIRPHRSARSTPKSVATFRDHAGPSRTVYVPGGQRNPI